MKPVPRTEALSPEKVAYWYFRLNGFLQIENFVVHPKSRGSQRTDADLIGVRFPHRAERLIDDPADIMKDDIDRLSLSAGQTDVVIVEVKSRQPCSLNGPWTREEDRNVHRVLAAIGCLPPEQIELAAAAIYNTGIYKNELGPRIRLVAVGALQCADLSTRFPEVTQLVWPEILTFIWGRFYTYRRQKAQADQWDEQGRQLKSMADSINNPEEFVAEARARMGMRTDNG